MAYGDPTFYTYPWSSSAAATSIDWQYNYSGTTQQFVYPTITYDPPPAPTMPESPMEWLRRRVTEITDLAYAA